MTAECLCRYMHYYQRWAENDKARAQARRLAKHAAEGQLHRLSELTATPTSQLKFICDAWDQVRALGTDLEPALSACADLPDTSSSAL